MQIIYINIHDSGCAVQHTVCLGWPLKSPQFSFTSVLMITQAWVWCSSFGLLALLSKGQQSCPSHWGKTIILWVMALRCFWRPERQSHAKQKRRLFWLLTLPVLSEFSELWHLIFRFFWKLLVVLSTVTFRLIRKHCVLNRRCFKGAYHYLIKSER